VEADELLGLLLCKAEFLSDWGEGIDNRLGKGVALGEGEVGVGFRGASGGLCFRLS
jgi:hypothetical protein